MGCGGSVMAACPPKKLSVVGLGNLAPATLSAGRRRSYIFEPETPQICPSDVDFLQATWVDDLLEVCATLNDGDCIASADAATITMLVDALIIFHPDARRGHHFELLHLLRAVLCVCRQWPSNPQEADGRLVPELLHMIQSEGGCADDAQAARKLAIKAMKSLTDRFDVSRDIVGCDGVSTLLSIVYSLGEDTNTEKPALACLLRTNDIHGEPAPYLYKSRVARDVSSLAKRASRRCQSAAIALSPCPGRVSTSLASSSLSEKQRAACCIPPLPEDSNYQFHCFISYNWGLDAEGRSNHTRASLLNMHLKSMGVSTWFDTDRLTGNNLVEQMARGIDSSVCVVVCITSKYVCKVGGLNGGDNCKKEFTYAEQRKSSSLMLPVVMEAGMKCQRKWFGPVGMALGGHIYQDMSGDACLKLAASKIAAEIQSICSASLSSSFSTSSISSFRDPSSLCTTGEHKGEEALPDLSCELGLKLERLDLSV